MQQTLRVFGSFLVAVLVATITSAAANASDTFKGKTVKIIVGYAAGGGYDRYARQVGRFIGKYLPGKPSVIVQNMPGAGSMTAANYLYNQAPKDGTVFGEFNRALPIVAFAGQSKRAHFDPLKFTWVGTSSSYKGETFLLVVRKDSGIKSISDLQETKKTIYLASTSAGSDGTDIPIVLRSVLGLNIEPLLGYPGGNTLYLAVDRGEAQGRMTGYSSVETAHPDWLKKDSPVRFVLQIGHDNRIAAFPNVPTAVELARNEADRNLIELIQAPFLMARPFAAPPGLSAETTKALRTAFMAAHEDPQYKAEAKKLHLITSPSDGAEVQKVVEQLAKIPRSVYDRDAAILAHPKAKIREVKWQIVDGTISKIAKKGRFEFEIDGKKQKSRMSNGYTKVMVGGKNAKTKAIKVGMACKIWYEGNNTYAGRLDCKG